MNDSDIQAIPFQEPSPQLFELLQLIQNCEHDLNRLCGMPREVEPSLLGWGERGP